MRILKPRASSSDGSAQRDALRRTQRAGKAQANRGGARVAGSQSPSGASPRDHRRSPLLIFAGLIVLALAGGQVLESLNVQGSFELTEAQIRATVTAPTVQPNVERATVVAVSPLTKRVGLISGHRGNDTGTVCADGYTEAQLTYETSVRAAAQLRALGYAVDILDEFDARLRGYSAAALLSIHADSCASINDLATGFKVARSQDSLNPQEEDKLVNCVSNRYSAGTGLKFNANTITHNMTQYHALYKVDGKTSAAIIEIGFLYKDRDYLTKHNDVVAHALVEGLQCYLNGEKV